MPHRQRMNKEDLAEQFKATDTHLRIVFGVRHVDYWL